MVEFEKRGLPTVSFTARTFERDAHRSAETFGIPQLPIAVMRLPFTNQPPEAIRTMVDECFDQVVAGLTSELPVVKPEKEITVIDEDWLTFNGEDVPDVLEAMNRRYLDYGWSDGFPLHPATEREVERMLTGTARSPQDVVAVLEPGFGIATVEKIAINAVMAGCRPEHLPVLIAAIECLADPRMCVRTKAMSTGPHAPLLVVNGPIRKKLGLNSGRCALGPGAPSYANTVIGRAVRLCMMNVGHCYAGISDMDTVGSPLKYSMCAAENEEASPWEPYHVERGYAADDNAVTVQFVYGLCELHDFLNYEAEPLAELFATAAKNKGQVSTGLWLIGAREDPRTGEKEKEHHFLFVCPEHADTFSRAGWSKQDLKRALYKKARMSFRTLMLNQDAKGLEMTHPELMWLWDSPETMLPVLEDPDCWEIAVVGGAAGRGLFMWGAGQPITKPIEARD